MKGFPSGDPRARAAGARGGMRSGHARWLTRLSRIKALWPSMPHVAAMEIRRYADTRYRSGWRAGRRERVA